MAIASTRQGTDFRVIDTLQKEGKSQKSFAKGAGYSERAFFVIWRKVMWRKMFHRKQCSNNRNNRRIGSVVNGSTFKSLKETDKSWTAAGGRRAAAHRTWTTTVIFLKQRQSLKPLTSKRRRRIRLLFKTPLFRWQYILYLLSRSQCLMMMI